MAIVLEAKRKTPSASNGKFGYAVNVTKETYDEIKKLQKITGLSMRAITEMLIKESLKTVEIKRGR